MESEKKKHNACRFMNPSFTVFPSVGQINVEGRFREWSVECSEEWSSHMYATTKGAPEEEEGIRTHTQLTVVSNRGISPTHCGAPYNN